MTLTAARNNLVLIWLSGFGLIFVLVSTQAAFGKYGTGSDFLTGYGWLFPLTVPVISLMLSFSTVHRMEVLEREIHNLTLFRCCQGVSIFFLVMMLAVPLIEPLIELKIQEFFRLSLVPFGVLHGLATGLIARFFFVNS